MSAGSPARRSRAEPTNPREPSGRQPDVLHITPSKPNPWYGTIVPGEKFTAEQMAELAARRLSCVEMITVRREATDREMYWPIGAWAPVYAFDCPVIGQRVEKFTIDGRQITLARPKVIAPNGEAKLIRADGWVRRPSRSPKGGGAR